MPTTLPTQHTTVQGLKTRHLSAGSGPPVLVLHGWGASIEAVYPIVTGLAPVATVHALDLPGFGQSDPPPQPWGVEDYQVFVAAFMDALSIEAPTIVGHSNGGRIAIRMAATEPARASRLVLVDAAGIRPKRTLRWYRRVGMAKIGKYAARFLGSPGERLRARLVGKAASADYLAAGEMRPTLVKLVNAELRPFMPAIVVPTLLVWGSEDSDTPMADAREMERLIPDAGLVILEGAGHFSYLDQPARFARIVAHFVAPNKAHTTLDPTSAQTTLDPASAQTTLDPTSAQTTLDPASAQTTLDPASAQTTLDPASAQATPNPTGPYTCARESTSNSEHNTPAPPQEDR